MPLTVLVLADPSDPLLARLRQTGDGIEFLIVDGSGADADAVEAAARGADAILVWRAKREMLERVFAAARRVRWIHTWSAGVEDFLFPALVTSDVVLTNTRGVYSRSLAEFVVGAMLYFAKDFARMKQSQAASRWDPFDVSMLHGATLGIVGYGDIGRSVGAFARAFGMKVLAQRRHPHRSVGEPEGISVVATTYEVCERADYLVLAAPLTPETRRMIGARELGAMKRSAVFINVGRGAVVDEAALIEALSRGTIRGAALDVFEEEPLAAGHPFFSMPNVLLSPHCADHTATWREDAMACFFDNLRRFGEGAELRNVVEKALGY